jgi:hypothetical protein
MSAARRMLPFCCLLLSGCAIHTPYAVVRYWADYNTERECAAEVDIYELLPSKPVWVRLMQWNYNVGPVASVKPAPVAGGKHRARRAARKNRGETEYVVNGPDYPPAPGSKTEPMLIPMPERTQPQDSGGSHFGDSPTVPPLVPPPEPDSLEGLSPSGPSTQASPEANGRFRVSQAAWLFSGSAPR